MILLSAFFASNSIKSDEINLKFIKFILSYVLTYITHLLNITSYTFPAMCKCVKIVPVPKQDRIYRPIAMFSYLFKIFKKLIYKQMNQYLYGNF